MCINGQNFRAFVSRERKPSPPFFSVFFLFFPFLCHFSASSLSFTIIVGRVVAPRLIVSPLRAVDKMHFVIAIDPLHSVLMRKWSDLHSCPAIRTKSMNHSVRSMISLPLPPTIPIVGKFIFNVHAKRHRVSLYSVLILTET